MSADQAAAIVAKAHELSLPNLARAVAIQFGCALRQKDVIGEWVKGPGGEQWTERLALGRTCEARLAAREADLEEQLLRNRRIRPQAPADRDGGAAACAVNESYRARDSRRANRQAIPPARKFAKRFREVARAAGVPDSIWNMDARAGAVTDAYDKGAREVDAMDLGTHTQLATNRRYSRNRLAATSRVAVLRFGGKNEPGKEGA
jgi:hypothetical protein